MHQMSMLQSFQSKKAEIAGGRLSFDSHRDTNLSAVSDKAIQTAAILIQQRA
jgi:hypothetical protein